MAEIDLDKTDIGRPRAAHPGDVLTVRLDETPTSGYRWELDAHDPGVLQPLDDDYTPASGDLMGGGGTRVFRFEVVGFGTSPLKLIRRRPWDAASVVEEFETTIDASD